MGTMTKSEMKSTINAYAALCEGYVKKIGQLERILDGLPQDAIEGGWTARGISAYAKQLETKVAALEAKVASGGDRDADLSLRALYEDACIEANKNAKDAARYRWLRDTLHGAKAGGGVEVNDALQVYEVPTPGEEVRIYWYQHTAIGFKEITASTIDEAIDEALQQPPGDAPA